MGRMSSADMLKGRRGSGGPKPGGNAGGARQPTAKKVAVTIPKGGRAHVEKASNGIAVTVSDKNYNTTQKVVATDPSKVSFE